MFLRMRFLFIVCSLCSLWGMRAGAQSEITQTKQGSEPSHKEEQRDNAYQDFKQLVEEYGMNMGKASQVFHSLSEERQDIFLLYMSVAHGKGGDDEFIEAFRILDLKSWEQRNEFLDQWQKSQEKRDNAYRDFKRLGQKYRMNMGRASQVFHSLSEERQDAFLLYMPLENDKEDGGQKFIRAFNTLILKLNQQERKRLLDQY